MAAIHKQNKQTHSSRMVLGEQSNACQHIMLTTTHKRKHMSNHTHELKTLTQTFDTTHIHAPTPSQHHTHTHKGVCVCRPCGVCGECECIEHVYGACEVKSAFAMYATYKKHQNTRYTCAFMVLHTLKWCVQCACVVYYTAHMSSVIQQLLYMCSTMHRDMHSTCRCNTYSTIQVGTAHTIKSSATTPLVVVVHNIHTQPQYMVWTPHQNHMLGMITSHPCQP